MDLWIWIVIGVVVLLILWVIGVYNGLIVLRNRKEDQWGQIEVQLKRRADLIPNLVETVKGYAGHEKSTLEDVIKARNTYVSASTPEDEMKASGELTGALSKLMMLTESYPELKANANFMSLQADLKDCEDKIAMQRQFYNDTVLKYNNKVEIFPGSVIAGLFNFKRASFFEAGEAAKEAPTVKF